MAAEAPVEVALLGRGLALHGFRWLFVAVVVSAAAMKLPPCAFETQAASAFQSSEPPTRARPARPYCVTYAGKAPMPEVSFFPSLLRLHFAIALPTPLNNSRRSPSRCRTDPKGTMAAPIIRRALLYGTSPLSSRSSLPALTTGP